MKIKRIKINGIINPVGFSFEHIALSYVVDGEVKGSPRLEIFGDAELKNKIYTQSLNFSKSYCETVNFKPQLETRYYFIISCGSTKSEACYFETGTKFDCKFITPQTDITHPVVFKEFNAPKDIVSARLYITGVGLYEAYINNKKVGNEYLTPYCNDYDDFVQYQTYDIADYFNENKNEIKILLGDGWYKGRFGLKRRSNIYGDSYAAAAKLVIVNSAGKKQIIETDESWLARHSNTVSSGIYDGEVIDDTINITKTFPVKFAEKSFNVKERISLPVVCKKELKPELIISPKGEKILDFKQNMSAVLRLESKLKSNETIRLSFGEVLQGGNFYRENLRTAKAEFVYTSDGQPKTVKQHFTFYGFRYVLVEGVNEVNPADFAAEVIYSDIEDTVWISTDNEKINRLLSNCKWGQYSNFVDVPTDCPQRDERLGWTGDAQVFSRAACFQTDSRAFYDKYMRDLSIDQKKYDGFIAMYSPSMKEMQKACSVWSDVAAIVPWNVYNFYGDKVLLEKYFPMMETYACKLIDSLKETGGWLCDFGFHLGDWLSQDGISPNSVIGGTNEHFIASMYYYNSINITAKAAKVLGYKDKQKQYEEIAKKIRQALVREYFSGSGRLCIDTQTAYSLCVNFGVYKYKDKLVSGFRERLKRDVYTVKGGFVGATQLIQSLINCGLTDEAFRILYSEKYPGWLHCVNLGATTIWERWNSLNADGTISSTGMNSLNHYSYGAVVEAFYAYIAGLKPVSAGFKNVEIKPVFNYRLKNLNFKYASPSGDYVVNYKINKNNTVSLNIQVPYGCKARLVIDNCTDFGEKMLSGGTYSFEIKLQTDINNPFSVDSPFCEILENPEAAKLFKENYPGFYHYFSASEDGLQGESMRYVTSLDSFRIPDEKIEEFNKKLRNINV